MNPQLRSQTTLSLLLRLLNLLLPPKSVIVLENVHWMDSASWALTLAVTQEKRTGLLVMTTRPMTKETPFQLRQILHQHTRKLRLQNLSREDGTKLIAQCLQVKEIPQKVATQVLEKTEGNPFLIISVVSALREAGALYISKTGEIVISEDHGTLPTELNGMLTSKVDKLTPAQQIMLK